MDFAARLAARLGLCDEGLVGRQRALLDRFGLPTRLPKISPTRAIQTMRLDKKVQEGRVYFVLPKEVGGVMVQQVDREDIVAIWHEGMVAKGKQYVKLVQRLSGTRRGGSL
jgi:3-dehydroquinate synthetase